uniref:Uncharacterized protein n=1 Tax=Cacopsylla melanoneura TaxID=428564 RepID=A0A8D8ZRT1_9HEMI
MESIICKDLIWSHLLDYCSTYKASKLSKSSSSKSPPRSTSVRSWLSSGALLIWRDGTCSLSSGTRTMPSSTDTCRRWTRRSSTSTRRGFHLIWRSLTTTPCI